MVGQSLKKGFSLTNSAMMIVFGLFLYNVIVGLIALPGQLEFIRRSVEQTQTPAGSNMIIFALTQLVIAVFALPFIISGLISYFKHAIEGQSELNIGLFLESKNHYFKILGLWIVLWVLFICSLFIGSLLAAVPALIGRVMAGEGAEPSQFILIVSGTLFFTMFITCVIGIMFFVFSPCEIAVSNKNLFPAMGGSIRLVKKNFLKTLLLCIVLGIIWVGIPVALTQLIVTAMKSVTGNLLILALVTLAFGSLVNAYVWPFMFSTLTAFYHSIALKEDAGVEEISQQPDSESRIQSEGEEEQE